MVHVAPLEVPRLVLDIISDATAKALKSQDFAESLTCLDLPPGHLGFSETRAVVKDESDRNVKHIKKVMKK
jgi:tripartite-type tricarboxylate transporter receptor subunit TctC